MKSSDTETELYTTEICKIKKVRKVNHELWQDLRKGTSCDISDVYSFSSTISSCSL